MAASWFAGPGAGCSPMLQQPGAGRGGLRWARSHTLLCAAAAGPPTALTRGAGASTRMQAVSALALKAGHARLNANHKHAISARPACFSPLINKDVPQEAGRKPRCSLALLHQLVPVPAKVASGEGLASDTAWARGCTVHASKRQVPTHNMRGHGPRLFARLPPLRLSEPTAPIRPPPPPRPPTTAGPFQQLPRCSAASAARPAYPRCRCPGWPRAQGRLAHGRPASIAQLAHPYLAQRCCAACAGPAYLPAFPRSPLHRPQRPHLSARPHRPALQPAPFNNRPRAAPPPLCCPASTAKLRGPPALCQPYVAPALHRLTLACLTNRVCTPSSRSRWWDSMSRRRSWASSAGR